MTKPRWSVAVEGSDLELYEDDDGVWIRNTEVVHSDLCLGLGDAQDIDDMEALGKAINKAIFILRERHSSKDLVTV